MLADRDVAASVKLTASGKNVNRSAESPWGGRSIGEIYRDACDNASDATEATNQLAFHLQKGA
jgi:hypothetical protein